MSGCKSLSDTEISLVTSNLTSLRDKALFIVGLKTGFRISELLSLSLDDVYQDNQVVAQVSVAKKSMKGKHKARTVILHPQAREALGEYCRILSLTNSGATPLFKSMKSNKAISRVQAHIILKEAMSGIDGRTGTHCMRKSFATRVHKALGNDVVKTSKALGHASITSTVNYLEVFQDEINKAITSI